MISAITMGWKSASTWVEYSFGFLTETLIGISINMLIGFIIMRRRATRLQGMEYGSVLLNGA